MEIYKRIQTAGSDFVLGKWLLKVRLTPKLLTPFDSGESFVVLIHFADIRKALLQHITRVVSHNDMVVVFVHSASKTQ